jgi:hypothetical protein
MSISSEPSPRGTRLRPPVLSPERIAELAADALERAQRWNGRWATCSGDGGTYHYYAAGCRPCDGVGIGGFPHAPKVTPVPLRCPACMKALGQTKRASKKLPPCLPQN